MHRHFGGIGSAAVIALALLTAGCALVPTSRFCLRVNAGDDKAYTGKAGQTWQAGKEYIRGGGFGFVGGSTVDRGTDMAIEGTAEARIYQTEHYEMSGFKAEVPNGKYTVRLHFAETYDGITGAGERVFDVTLQDKEVLRDFDVFKTAGGSQKAVVKEFRGVAVNDGVLSIGFAQKVQLPEINGIEIIAE